MKNKELKSSEKVLAIACGGTGGHFYPGLSVARAASAEGWKVWLLLTGKNALRQSETAKAYGLPSLILPKISSPGSIIGKARFLIHLIGAVQFSRHKLREIKADRVLAMGSFACVPVAMAAVISKIPLFLHEGNSRIGKANRFLSRWARQLGIAFPPVNARLCRCPCSITGMPIRPELLTAKLNREEACQTLNKAYGSSLQAERITLLILGGSQGARTLNTVLPEAISEICKEEKMPCQLIHLTGTMGFETTIEAYAKLKIPKLVLARTEHMNAVYAIADLAVSRAGGSTLAEMACFGIPAILVPFPFAAEKHQDDNAKAVNPNGMLPIIQDEECQAKIRDLLQIWLNEPEIRRECGSAIKQLAKPEATQAILKLIS